MGCHFIQGAVDKEISRSPEFGNMNRHTKFQVLGRTRGGTRFNYDKGIDVEYLDIRLTYLTDAEKDDIEDFFNDESDGIMESFTFRDHEDVDWNVKFVNATLDFTEDRDSGWSIHLQLEVVS